MRVPHTSVHMDSLCFNVFCVGGGGVANQTDLLTEQERALHQSKTEEKEGHHHHHHHRRLVLGSEVEAHYKTDTTLCQQLSILSLPPFPSPISSPCRSGHPSGGGVGKEHRAGKKQKRCGGPGWRGGVRSSSGCLAFWDVWPEEGFYLFSTGRRGAFDGRWPCSLTCCGPLGSWRNPWRRAEGLHGAGEGRQKWCSALDQHQRERLQTMAKHWPSSRKIHQSQYCPLK